MSKNKTAIKHRISKVDSHSLLPIDTRILPDLFRFGHISGIAKFFLTVEIILSSLIVIASISISIYKLLSR